MLMRSTLEISHKRDRARVKVARNRGGYTTGDAVQIIKPVVLYRHRDNILDRRYRDIGVGVASGAPEDVGGALGGTYSAVFGQRSKR